MHGACAVENDGRWKLLRLIGERPQTSYPPACILNSFIPSLSLKKISEFCLQFALFMMPLFIWNNMQSSFIVSIETGRSPVDFPLQVQILPSMLSLNFHGYSALSFPERRLSLMLAVCLSFFNWLYLPLQT